MSFSPLALIGQWRAQHFHLPFIRDRVIEGCGWLRKSCTSKERAERTSALAGLHRITDAGWNGPSAALA
jgi:hypothetical protein